VTDSAQLAKLALPRPVGQLQRRVRNGLDDAFPGRGVDDPFAFPWLQLQVPVSGAALAVRRVDPVHGTQRRIAGPGLSMVRGRQAGMLVATASGANTGMRLIQGER
jgi:hypothetical protein